MYGELAQDIFCLQVDLGVQSTTGSHVVSYTGLLHAQEAAYLTANCGRAQSAI